MTSISTYSLVWVSFVIIGTSLPTEVDACNAAECVHVEIYYEALCPDSKAFIAQQLASSYNDLKNHLDIKFVPYGKAKHSLNSEGKWVFNCQHGPTECEGNRGQACVLEAIKKYTPESQKQDISIEFVNCSMRVGYRKCVPETLPVEAHTYYEDCLTSPAGVDLMVEHGNNTHGLRPVITFIPTITINHIHSPADQENIRNNFKGYVCGTLLDDRNKPSVCQ